MQRRGEEEEPESAEALGKFLVRLSGLADEGWEPALLVLDGNTLNVYRREQVCAFSALVFVCFVLSCRARVWRRCGL
jgi:hypothetical protein